MSLGRHRRGSSVMTILARRLPVAGLGIAALVASLLTVTPATAAPIPLLASLGKPVPGHSAPRTPATAAPRSSTSTAVPAAAVLTPGKYDLHLPVGHQHGTTTRNTAGVRVATATGSWEAVGSTGITAAPASSAADASLKPVTGVSFELVDNATARKHHLSGLVLKIARTDGGTTAAPVAVRVPKKLLTSLYGADFADRVQWVQVPADSTAKTPRSTPVAADQSAASSTVMMTPKVSSKAVMVAAASSAVSSSGTGSFAATSLKPATSWDVSAQTGDFSWQYPMTAPPSAAGPAPDLSFQYDSQSVDGETGSTNNQPSAIGEGWAMSGAGFIERQYVSCSQDDGSSGAVTSSGDLCWKTDNAVLSLGGHSAPLVRDATTGAWKMASDDGSRIDHLTGTSQGCAANGTYDTDCWRVTTTDGTQYHFGLNQLPGYSSGNATTNSTWTVPVFGNDAGEPCHASTFAASSCAQAWRWNLDYVVDVHNNAEAFYYNAETNSYAKNGGAATAYIRGGQLNRIEYGLTASTIYTANAASDKVTFGYNAYGRCSDSSHSSCTAENITNAATKPATPSAYPDVPFDQLCTTSCSTNLVPTFWTDGMLDTVTTAARTASTTYSTVDTWTLGHSFPAPGDGTNAALWLTQIQHTGTSGSTTLTEPATTFTGTTMQNRVWAVDGLAPLDKWRIASITGATGAVTSVNYTGQDCQPSEAKTIEANAATNTRRCYPEWWVPAVTPAQPAQIDLFHKYMVTSVVSDPKTGGGADRPQVSNYVYTGTAAWRYNTSLFTPANHRTWDQFAGYNTVEVRVGDPATPSTQQTTAYTFYQGLDGDRASTTGGTKSVSVTGAPGVADSPWFAGQVRETKTLNGVGGAVIGDTVTTPWVSAVEANDGTNTARMVGEGTTTEVEPTAAGGNRAVTTTTTHGDYGNPTSVNTTTSDAGSSCTTTTYAPANTTVWLTAVVQEERTVGVACGQNPSLPNDAVSDTRTAYDGTAVGSVPSRGDATSAEAVDSYSGSTPHWSTTSQVAYDTLGRPTSTKDALNRTSTTVYTPATSGPTTKTVTTNPSPFNWSTTTTFDPTRGSVLSQTTADGGITSAAYDALGRRVSVWQPERPQSANATSPSIAYAYVESKTAPLSVATTTVMAHELMTTYALYDGLGRPVQTQRQSGSGGTVVTDTQYDSVGNAVLTNNDYWTNSVSPSATLFVPENQQQIASSIASVFDGAGRQTASITNSFGKERFRTTTSFKGADEVDTTPPSGGTASATISNTLGQKTKLVQYLGSTPSAGTAQQATTYGYDAAGNMTSMADPAGNTWTWRYDLNGNKVQAVDPDTGTSSFSYDAVGNLLSSTDGRGQTLSYAYDALDRKTAEYSGTTSGSLLDSWTWDTLKKGLLTSSSSYTGSTPGTPGAAYTSAVTGYDGGNQPTGTTISIPSSAPAFGGTTYTTSATYNQDETLNNQSLPAIGGLAAEKTTYSWDGLGQLGSIGGTASYASVVYTAIGQVAQINRQGNLTNYSTYGYDPATGAISDIMDSTSSSATTQADRSYTRNDAGAITSVKVTGAAGAETQCYGYDGLQELTEAWTPSSGTCSDARSSSTLGGPSPYWNSYTYDTATGNRLTTTKHAVGTGTDEVDTYQYRAAGAVNPHGVQAVTKATGASSVTDAYGYDAVGDTTARPNQALSYDAEGKLSTVSVNGKTQSNIYDADGNLLLQSDPTSGSTLYLGMTEVHQNAGSTATTATRTYSINGTPVDERTTTSGTNKVFSIDTDIDGTSDLEVGASDKSITRRWVDPFGNQRGGSNTWSSTHGFLNQTASSFSNLTQLGARAYDATLGRFLSVDPVFSTDNPQQDNGYSYSANSPITFADPSGACYVGSSDSFNFNTNCSTGKGKAVSHGSSAAPGPGRPYKAPKPYMGSTKTKHATSNSSGTKVTPRCTYDGGVSCGAASAPPEAKPTKNDSVLALLQIESYNNLPGWYKPYARWYGDHEGAIAASAGVLGLAGGTNKGSNSFGSKDSLDYHFGKHRDEFDYPTKSSYAKGAQDFILRGVEEHAPTKVDDQGVIRIWDPETGEFGAFNPDGTTRTYFKPGKPGKYWAKQPGEVISW